MFYKILAVAILAFIANRGLRIKSILTPAENIKYNDKNCALKGNMKGNEDVVLGKHSVLFFGASGDLSKCFGEGAAAADHGGIYAYNVQAGKSAEPIHLRIQGYPHQAMHVHGMYVSRSTDRMYFVNHLGPETVIEIVGIEYNVECLKTGWKCTAPVKLTHVKTIRSPLFLRYGMNDVVEGLDGAEIYVSQWQPFDMPTDGQKSPSKTMMEKIQLIAGMMFQMLGVPYTAVYRCTIDQGECSVASNHVFIMANGMAVTPNKTTYFVSDPLDRSIAVLKREDDGFLTVESYIQLPHLVDNVDFIPETEELVLGTMTEFGTALKRAADESLEVPGGCSVARKVGDSWTIEDVLVHDGSQLSQISACAVHDKTVVLGSPYSGGILVCSTEP